MAYIASIGLGIPNYEFTQEDVKSLVKTLFNNNRKLTKLLPVFDNAMIETRQLVKDKSWYEKSHTFPEKNAAYVECARDLSLEAMDQCLAPFKTESDFRYEWVDAIVFVSSSGIATPSMDVHLINERNFREDVVRMPLWGLGCAGGAMGLARGFEWLQANPDKTALVVTCELCSLTFQPEDESMSNLVGTTLFGDGASAALLIGEHSPYRINFSHLPVIRATSSQLQKGTIDIMGWNVADEGLEVIFSKKIPKLIPDLWKEHVARFLKAQHIAVEEIGTFLAHPGGKKVLEAMEDTFQINPELLRYSRRVLNDHGNMSSATVFYVVKKWLEEKKPETRVEHALLSALGPGFSSELMLLERG